MKIRYNLLAIAALALIAAPAAAQVAAGRIIRASDFSVTDMLQFSQYDYSMGTARSAAMGGAFVSLGADLSTMALNPAGLGMYRSSDFSMSPSITWNKTTSSFPDRYVTTDENKFTRFALGNIGAALNTYQSTRGLTSFTFGFSYTKLADFNYNYNIGLDDQEISITDIFSQQINGINPEYLSVNSNPFKNSDIAPNQWGAVLGYQTFAVDPDSRFPNDYYYRANLWRGASDTDYAWTNNMLLAQSEGSLGEYNISGGMNFRNVFYLGFTLGIQDLYCRQYMNYEEIYDQPYDPQVPRLSVLYYDQSVKYAGTGVNFKLGMIFRPIESLRIGLAVHTPTFMAMDREYRITNMDTRQQDGYWIENPGYSDYLVWRYKYTSPTRLMAGLSYNIDDVVLIAADYEKVWYNGMRLGSSDDYYVPDATRDYFKEDVKYAFKSSDNFRAGLEIKPVPQFAIRAGYALTGSPLTGNQNLVPTASSPTSILDNPVNTKTESFSAGLGFRAEAFYADLTYVHTDYEFSKYAMYWYDGPVPGMPQDQTWGAGPVSSSMKRNTMTLTLGVRF